jgi:uncharacterized membrane protein YeaQ/YmgE (transglycosylase-associated protein family)
MGWIGTIFVGAVVGLSGWWLQRPRVRAGMRLWLAVVLAAAAAVIAKLAGNLTGFFYDGQTLEWLAIALAAIATVTVLGSVAAR